MNNEADGVDITKLFADLKMDNLVEIEKIPRVSTSSLSWAKKEKIVYQVQSGVLKDALVTSATYAEYQN